MRLSPQIELTKIGENASHKGRPMIAGIAGENLSDPMFPVRRAETMLEGRKQRSFISAGAVMQLTAIACLLPIAATWHCAHYRSRTAASDARRGRRIGVTALRRLDMRVTRLRCERSDRA